MGLFAGLSLISLFEAVEFVIKVLEFICGTKLRKVKRGKNLSRVAIEKAENINGDVDNDQ